MIGRYKPGNDVPVFANAQITGGHFVKITGAAGAGDAPENAYPAQHCGSGQRAFGVAQDTSGPTTHDPTSQTRMVNTQRGGVARLRAGAAVDALAEVMSGSDGRAITYVEGAAGAASLNTGVVGSNNAITWTAREGGAEGNAITIAMVFSDANVADTTVDVDGTDIVVTLESNDTGSGTILATAADVIAAINEHDVASQLVSVDDTGASTGAGVVAAVAETNLAGGSGTGNTVSLGQALTAAAEADDIIEVALF